MLYFLLYVNLITLKKFISNLNKEMIDKMNYYEEIKQELIDNEINKKNKDYSKNKYELKKNYNVGKLLYEQEINMAKE